MPSISPATRIYLALSPLDMRMSFNGLCACVQAVRAEDLLPGRLFVFTNRMRNRLKLHFFEGSGLWVCAKRIERGVSAGRPGRGPSCCLRSERWQLLLHGIVGNKRWGVPPELDRSAGKLLDSLCMSERVRAASRP